MKLNNLRKDFDRDTNLFGLVRQLVTLGCRTTTLKKMGLVTEYTDRVVDKCVQDILEAVFVSNPFKRAPFQSAKNTTFLKDPTQRYHASVIHAFSLRINLAEKIANQQFPEALVCIYCKYLEVFEITAHEAPLTINDAYEVITGVRQGVLTVNACSNCSSQYLSNPRRPPIKKCYVCQAHAHPVFAPERLEAAAVRQAINE